ncbi:MAG: hypothetical protein K2N52_06130, partial [Clostridia bacterium]|nr:hypothetical protein [Clostridia bacterium]
MRKIKTRNLLTVILSAFCAVFLCSSVIMLNGISNKNADAQTSAYTVTVDEIYKGNGKTTVSATESVFDGINMQKLYAQITGDANADYSTVAALASGDVTATTLSANAKKINSSYNDIIVKFAGLDWTATLLTTDSNQNVVLTLWLASHYISGDPLVDQWNTQASNTNGPYPNGMYGTSYIRAAVLNNGGNYAATYNATTLTDVAQDADNTFARFTMNSVTDNVTQFLVKPANVASSSKSSVHRNDVGIPYFGNSSDANVIATYTRWLEDLLWLPSSTEVLSGNLWQTTATQRTNTSTGVWTRSAGSGHYYYARVLTASGTDAYYTTNSRYGIRPALYLNLTLAEGNASEAIRVPTVDKTEVTYDPSATQSFTLDYDDTKVSLKSLTAKTTSGVDIASSTYSFNQCVLNAKEAGTYTMTFEIVQPSNPDQLYEWQDSETNSDDTRTVTVTIKRKEYGVPTINNSTQTYKGADYLFDVDSHFDPSTMEIARPNGIT